jgi:hypothetical protein
MQIFKSQLKQAISKAVAEAEVRRARLAATLEPGRIAQILGDEAENARMSPLAYDQLLALALDAAAEPGHRRSPVLDALRERPSPIEQLQLRRHVFTAYDVASTRAVARAAPDWAMRRTSRDERANPARLAAFLRREADLNRELWDHPALPVAPAFRALMLGCVEALRSRAAAVARTRVRRRHGAPSPALPEGAPA